MVSTSFIGSGLGRSAAALCVAATGSFILWSGSRSDAPPATVERATTAESELDRLLGSAAGVFAGTIVDRRVEALDPGDGIPLVVTRLRLVGRHLIAPPGAPGSESDDESIAPGMGLAPTPPPSEQNSLDLTTLGGVLDAQTASFIESAPAAHELRLGRGLVVFYVPADGLGADWVLFEGRSGLFTTFVSQSGDTIVQGRSTPAAVQHNMTLTSFEAMLQEHVPERSGPPAHPTPR